MNQTNPCPPVNKNDWVYGGNPTESGWYAIIYCWETNEGGFIGADHWDGEQWESDYPLCGLSSVVFENKKQAMEWAELNDCSW